MDIFDELIGLFDYDSRKNRIDTTGSTCSTDIFDGLSPFEIFDTSACEGDFLSCNSPIDSPHQTTAGTPMETEGEERNDAGSEVRRILKGRCVSLRAKSSDTPPQSSGKKFALSEIDQIIKSTTDPRGKFLRDLELTPEDALRIDIMAFLESVPRRLRTKYGKRKTKSKKERMEQSKMRNREHAKATRERRKLYTKIIEMKMSQLDSRVLKFLEKKPDYQHLKELQVKGQKVKDFFKIMDSSGTLAKSTWLKFGLEGILCKSEIKNFDKVVHNENCGWEQPKKLMSFLLEELRTPMNIPRTETESQVSTFDHFKDKASSTSHREISFDHNVLSCDHDMLTFAAMLLPTVGDVQLTRVRLLEPYRKSSGDWSFSIGFEYENSAIGLQEELLFSSDDMYANIRFVEDEKAWKISGISFTLDIDSAREFLRDKSTTVVAQIVPKTEEIGGNYIEL